MAAWVLIPCLVELRDEFNRLNPKRDKGADGAIGDSSHTSSSDHTPDEDSRVLKDHDADSKNEVHALDVDSDGPWPGTGNQKERFHRINMRIIAAERAKWLSESDRCRLNYMIWDRKIYDKDNDFEPQPYRGSDPHTNHAHFSGRYETSCENDTRPWGAYVPPAPPKEEAPVTQPGADETLKVTETTGKELFEPDRPAGTEVSEDSVLQLAAIHSRRAALDAVKARDNAAAAKDGVAVLDQRFAGLSSDVTLLQRVLEDPAGMDDPESHPIVRAVRYALDNPASEQA